MEKTSETKSNKIIDLSIRSEKETKILEVLDKLVNCNNKNKDNLEKELMKLKGRSSKKREQQMIYEISDEDEKETEVSFANMANVDSKIHEQLMKKDDLFEK